MFAPGFIILLLTFSLTLSLTAAHTFLTSPDGYNRINRLHLCRGKVCKQACPPIPDDLSKLRNTPTRPAQRWRRGQTVTIKWARNNHANGFVRFTIVPVNVMMDRSWHSRLSFYTGCFNQNPYRCHGERECGADQSKTAHERRIKIPTIYPDGDYVFGMVWFGGAIFPYDEFPNFHDYFSCSYISIRGGTLEGAVQPSFHTGKVIRNRFTKAGKCYACVNEPGKCGKIGCRRKPKWRFPKGFRPKDPKPRVVAVSDVEEARNA